MIGREEEFAICELFLGGLRDGPGALTLRGDAGIGKTTIWAETVARAAARGYRVLSCRPVEAEAKLSYAAVADLLSALDDGFSVALPDPQRRALDAAILRGDPPGKVVDQRAVAAAVASILVAAAGDCPLVVAVDDVQWLDSPSARILAFAARRVGSARVGFLVSLRASGGVPAPLGLERALPADRVRAVAVGRLSLGALRELVGSRLGGAPSRPALLHIERVSGGNPFFALEVAQGLTDSDGFPLGASEALPERLTELVAGRVERLPASTREALLLVSALTDPTVAVIERAGCRADSLDPAEAAGVIAIRDGRVRCSHPLLASFAYTSVTRARRRDAHRLLAAAVSDPEERARHLALAADGPDGRVASALERAAMRARARGAPDTAAELLERALALTPAAGLAARRRRAFAAAEDHFYAGDRGRARTLLEGLKEELPPTPLRAGALHLLAEVHYYDDSWPAAVPLLEEALELAGPDLGLRARIELDLAYAYFNLGNPGPVASLVEAALEHAESSANGGLIAQMLAAHLQIGLMLGRGLDQAQLERALSLEDWDERAIIVLTPSWLVAESAFITGELEQAHAAFDAIRAELVAHGRESDLPATAALTVWTECLRGELVAARRIAEEAVTAALEFESQTTRALALAARAFAYTYSGRVDEARRDGEEALRLLQAIGWTNGSVLAVSTLGFLSLSEGDAAGAHARLNPLAAAVHVVGVPEPILAPFLPDEIEALVALGQLVEAEPLLELLEQRGRELDRPWALAASARCRGLLLAARGDLPAAAAALERALTQHARVDMPVELARTLLVLGQVQRRHRQKRAAKESLERAREIFERVGAQLWSAKVVAELTRLGMRRPRTFAAELTETERRVAELAATGLTNREIATQLFVSPKTVQANLARVYGKLGIHSRAELGARVARGAPLQT